MTGKELGTQLAFPFGTLPSGLTKREMFAMTLMAARIGNSEIAKDSAMHGCTTSGDYARIAVACADSLLDYLALEQSAGPEPDKLLEKLK